MLVLGEPALEPRQFLFRIEGGAHADARREAAVSGGVRHQIERVRLSGQQQTGRTGRAALAGQAAEAAQSGQSAQAAQPGDSGGGGGVGQRAHAHGTAAAAANAGVGGGGVDRARHLLLEPSVELAAHLGRRRRRSLAADHLLLPLLPFTRHTIEQNLH